MSAIELSRTCTTSIYNHATSYGRIDVSQRGDVIWLEVEDPDRYEVTEMNVLVTATEARQLAAALTALADDLERRAA